MLLRLRVAGNRRPRAVSCILVRRITMWWVSVAAWVVVARIGLLMVRRALIFCMLWMRRRRLLRLSSGWRAISRRLGSQFRSNIAALLGPGRLAGRRRLGALPRVSGVGLIGRGWGVVASPS